jgi:hypothetical protein
VYWQKENQGIIVDYGKRNKPLLSETVLSKLEAFSKQLTDDATQIDDLISPKISKAIRDKFWTEYEQIPVVNPTKWKFHETVYEEHYYQMLRMLSYELEKQNAVLITFGFSFADEHILNLVKRSLSNPHLKVFVCCFDKAAQNTIRDMFKGHRNVECLVIDNEVMDFSVFNKTIFTSKDAKSALPTEDKPVAPVVAAGTATA